MSGHAVDTNVLLAASTADPASPFGDTTHVPPDQLLQVLDWVMAFRADPQARLVLDYEGFIRREYYNQLSAQDLGMLILIEKLPYADFRHVTYQDGVAVLPSDLETAVTDRSDRKYVAVALHDPTGTEIVNACDTDWYDCEAELLRYGIRVRQLAELWCRSAWEGKRV